MDARRLALAVLTAAAVCVIPSVWPGAFGLAEAQGFPPPPIPADELPRGAEVLTSGPVHEAFAAPVTLEVQTGVVVPKAPPADVREIPPGHRPLDPNAAWIPGYWAWDGDRGDHLWVSGCWRIAPPGMFWMPGYWAAAAGGYEWVPGFWAPLSEASPAVEYLPAPPATTDVEPRGEAPADDDLWVPGCWYWVQGRYVERPGYWLAARSGWLWVPSCYSRTPRGYVFLPGHWDYPLGQRGILLAPVYFPPNARAFAGLAFSPSVSVDLSILKISLFTCPRYGHYYFGDFYDDAYLRAGIYPWFMCETNRTWYDPVFEYSRWYLEKVAPNWPERQRHEYDLRRADPRLRPARTWTEMQARFAAVPEADRRYFGTAEPIDAVAGRGSRAARFERIDGAERQRLAGQAEQVREFGRQRAAWEVREPAPAAGTRGPRIFRGLRTPQSGQPGEPDRVRIPSPPIFARPVERTVDDAMPSYPRGEREHSRERDR